MTIFAVTMGAVLGMPAPIVRMRESGVLRGLKVSGVPSWSIFLMQAVSTGKHLTFVALVIFITAPPRLIGYLFPGTYVMQAFSDGAFHSRIDWQTLPALLVTATIGLLAILFSAIRYRSIARSLW